MSNLFFYFYIFLQLQGLTWTAYCSAAIHPDLIYTGVASIQSRIQAKTESARENLRQGIFSPLSAAVSLEFIAVPASFRYGG
ncbi:hypothetical protein DDV23_02445 [Streptococcus chenjunshii]|uniref:Uncharacterized protein n=1 Tax=Streptococcus chenjunshii TaxID=2173853 RepID=A0A372KN79_9STRE|nr:hypothetical protein DDV22_10680 [Streptococcus chenjunshii]RFU53751.1 hypothetical protein DDV23_02445 [Streptococcus chenjunshii]